MEIHKKIMFAMLASFVLLSCGKEGQRLDIKTPTLTDEQKEAKVETLFMNKTFVYSYGKPSKTGVRSVYEVSFFEPDSVRWVCIEGEEEGDSGIENCHFQRINGHAVLLAWIEKDGTAVSQLLDFNRETVNTFLFTRGNIVRLSGKLAEKKQEESTEALFGNSSEN